MSIKERILKLPRNNPCCKLLLLMSSQSARERTETCLMFAVVSAVAVLISDGCIKPPHQPRRLTILAIFCLVKGFKNMIDCWTPVSPFFSNLASIQKRTTEPLPVKKIKGIFHS